MPYNSTLKDALRASITTPANPKISGTILQQQLLAIVNAMEAGAVFMGAATPATSPTGEANCFYLAATEGTYNNFLDIYGHAITIGEGEAALLSSIYDNNALRWKKNTFPGRTYLHIMYSVGQPAQDSDIHATLTNGDKWIGICADLNNTAPTKYDSYQWAKFVGEDGEQGTPAHNPNCGTYTNIADAPAVGQDGDYIVVVSGDPATGIIYKWDATANDNAGGWVSTGAEANEAEFATGQKVIETPIDKTHLENPASRALAKAEDVMLLKSKLAGIDLTETKVALVENTNWFDNTYLKDSGVISTSSGGNGILVVNVQRYKRVRFLGIITVSKGTVGYGFSAEEPDITDTINVQVEDALVFDYGAEQLQSKEYIVDVPEDKPWFVCTIRKGGTNQIMTISSFYCYLQNGNAVIDEIEKRVPKEDVSEYKSFVIKNLINKDDLVNYWLNPANSYAESNVGTGYMSNKLHLQDGRTYTASNIALRTENSVSKGCLILFDSQDNAIGHTYFDAIADSQYGTGSSYWKKRGYGTFTYQQGSEEYCRLIINANIPLNFDAIIAIAQLEVGEEPTSLAGYNEVLKYDFARGSDVENLEERVDNTVDYIDNSVKPVVEAMGDSVDEELQPDNTNTLHKVDDKGNIVYNNYNDLKTYLDIDDSKQYYISGYNTKRTTTRWVHYFDENDEYLGYDVYKGSMDSDVSVNHKPLTLPAGTTKICVNAQIGYQSRFIVFAKTDNIIDVKELKRNVDNLNEEVSPKLMKVVIKETGGVQSLYVRSKFNATKDIVVAMEEYMLTNNTGKSTNSLTLNSVYVGNSNDADEEIMVSANKISSPYDSIGAIGTKDFGYLFAQHGWTIIRIPKSITLLDSTDIGSKWQGVYTVSGTTYRKNFVVGNVSSSYVYMIPEITYNDVTGVYEASWDGNNTYPKSYEHVSGGTHTETFSDSEASSSNRRYDLCVQTSHRQFIVDGVEVGAGAYYCDDFIFNEFVEGRNPAKVEPTDWFESEIPYDGNLINWCRSFVFKGSAITYNCSINDVDGFKFDSFYGIIPQMLQQFTATENDESVVYHSYTAIPKAKTIDDDFLSDNLSKDKLIYPQTNSPSSDGSYERYGVYDITNLPERVLSFIKSDDNIYYAGMAGGYSLVDGITVPSVRNQLLNGYDSYVCHYGHTGSTKNKFYPKALVSDSFQDGIMRETFVHDFCGYICWFDPSVNNDDIKVYFYKHGSEYIVYVHAFSILDKVEVVLPEFMDGMKVGDIIEKTNGASILTNVVSCNKIYCSFGGNDGGQKDYVVFKVK